MTERQKDLSPQGMKNWDKIFGKRDSVEVVKPEQKPETSMDMDFDPEDHYGVEGEIKS